MADILICGGVAKSGSPAVSETTSCPAAFICRASVVNASVWDSSICWIFRERDFNLRCSLLRKFAEQPFAHRWGDKLGDIPSVHGNFSHDARIQIRVLFMRHK